MNGNSANDRHSEHGHSVLSNQYLEDKTAVSPGVSSSLLHSDGFRVGAAGQCCLSADVIRPQDQLGFCKHCHVAISAGEICFGCSGIKMDHLTVGYQCVSGEVQYAAQKTTKLNPTKSRVVHIAEMQHKDIYCISGSYQLLFTVKKGHRIAENSLNVKSEKEGHWTSGM